MPGDKYKLFNFVLFVVSDPKDTLIYANTYLWKYMKTEKRLLEIILSYRFGLLLSDFFR